MKKSVILAAALAAMLAVPVFADDHGRGHDKHEERERADHRDEHHEEVRQGAYFNDHHREDVRRYYVEHYGGSKGCPPGLAKKHNGCMPPGQARRWAVGSPVPRDVVVYSVPQPVLTMLPGAPVGYRYEQVGSDIVLMHVSDRLVVDVMLNIR